MTKANEGVEKIAKETVDNSLKSLAAVTQSAQAIAMETTEYMKRSYEDGVAAWKGVVGAKSLERAVELQTTYAKSAYEAFVAQATKVQGLYADLGKEIAKPFETALAKGK